ncbi:elongation factor P hydroxylase [Budvicia diplopodorum]|uniref:elongation factor P hydroxylase n=1 Tax=Budvicia diplopodorum TaxID=1119056 RepID=UPI00135C8456|nr:elongation factor P hydroxylase [Budvicia diplopodorum]
MTIQHNPQDLIDLFERTFGADYQTKLVNEGDEPIYLPADETTPYSRIIFAHGYYASAFHEISHWCIAGAERRKLVDFGYWYCPDGRSAEKQAEFEVVEIKPQAFDWLFSVASGFPFSVSCDNLNSDIELDRVAFQRKVHAQVMDYLAHGIPERPARFIQALQNFYHTKPLSADDFPYPEYWV